MSYYTPEQAKAEALAGFKATGPAHINCSQAVVRFALLLLDADPELVTAARYFGGGVAGMGEACGAVTGAAMALGIRDFWLDEDNPEREAQARERLQELIRAFRGKFETCRCRDLIGFDLSNPADREAFMMSEVRSRCTDFVGWMCESLAPLLLASGGPAAD